MVKLSQLFFIACLLLVFATDLIGQDDSTILKDSTNTSKVDVINADTLVIDSTTTSKKTKFKFIKSILDKKYPNPNRAAAMSFVLPGAGQFYNKKYWKIPIVYGALFGLGYFALDSNKEYNRFADAYLLVVDDDPNTLNPFPTLSESSLRTIRDRFNKQRQQGYVFFTAAWLLNSIDAYVYAHLASFDVNEDISAHIQPVGIPSPNNTSYGLSITFVNNQTKKVLPPFQF